MAATKHIIQRACVDPPPNLLSKIQTMFFFWHKFHWIPQAALCLPKEEGGQGLIHLASRGAALNTVSLHWLLQEPVVYEEQHSAPVWAGTSIRDTFRQARVMTLGSVVHLTGAGLQDSAALAAGVGIRSVRSMGRQLEHWRGCLTGHQHLLLSRHSQSFIAPCTDDPFPSVTVRPVFKDCSGLFLNAQQCTSSLQEATGKALYMAMVKCLNQRTLNHVDTPWRGHLQLCDGGYCMAS